MGLTHGEGVGGVGDVCVCVFSSSVEDRTPSLVYKSVREALPLWQAVLLLFFVFQVSPRTVRRFALFQFLFLLDHGDID